MNNQTIDGVPRELRNAIQHLIDNHCDAEGAGEVIVQREDFDELRALLDADECCHEFVPFQANCTKCGIPYKPTALLDVSESQYNGMTSAQAQGVSDGVDDMLMGKPVAYLDLEKIQPAGMAYATKVRVNHRQTPLYAEQPAQPINYGSLDPVERLAVCRARKGHL